MSAEANTADVSHAKPPQALATRALQFRFSGAAAAIEGAFLSLAGERPPRFRRSEDVFYDTADGALFAAGSTLAARRRRGRRFARLRPRSANCGSMGIEIAWPDDAALQSLFAEAFAAAGAPDQPDLTEIATRTAARREATTTRGRTQIRVRHSIETVIANGANEKAHRLSLVLAGGDAGPLIETAMVLARQFKLALDFADPLERALVAAGVGAMSARRSVMPQAAPDLGLDEFIGVVIDECLAHFTDNWRLLACSDAPESIHQMRVGLRRMRAALAVFNRAFPHETFAHLRGRAKDIATVLGQARDIDAFVGMVQDGPLDAMGPDKSLDALLEAAEVERKAGYSAARALIADPETSMFVLSVLAFTQKRGWRNAVEPSDLPKLISPSIAFSREVLSRLNRRVLKQGKGLAKRTPDERHELRIALKNLRYAAEFFGCMHQAQDVRKFNRAIGRLQDLLGAYNDGVVACALVARLEEIGGGPTLRAAGAIEGWCRRGAIEADHGLESAWSDFKKLPVFW